MCRWATAGRTGSPPSGWPRVVLPPQGELAYLRSKLASWAEPIPAMLAATDPDDVLRNDLDDRSAAARWAAGPVVLVGDAAHPMRPHLGQGGCQALEDAAVLGALVELSANLPNAFAAFESFRRRRVSGVVRELCTIGQLVNLRPAPLSAARSRATVLVPEVVMTRHLATIAARVLLSGSPHETTSSRREPAGRRERCVSGCRVRWRWPCPGR